MGKKHKPRSGSLAFYPKKRAKKEMPSFKTFSKTHEDEENAKAVNFLGYKVGMLHAAATNEAQKTIAYGEEIVVPCTVIECPPLKVFGVKAYKKTTKGIDAVYEVLTDKFDKNLKRKINTIGKKSKKKGKGSEEKNKKTIDSLTSDSDSFDEIRLLVHTQPALTGIGKKKPEVTEVSISGSKEKQVEYAKSKLGQDLKVSEIFESKQFIDVKAVDKGKGFQGVVKRAGVKIQRPKAKKHRVVGSISPWHPATVMWTVARPGQLGYQTRTEYNKRLLRIDSDLDAINPKEGFKGYGLVKNDYLIISGSVPGPRKRCVAIRHPIRKSREKQFKLGDLSFISTVNK